MVADEARIAKESYPDYVWSEKGQTPIKKKKLEIHKSTTIFGALSMKIGKVIQHHCKNKKKQTTFLLDKIKQFKEKYYSNTKKKILLIWDNAGCHKSEEVKQWLRDNPGVVELDNFPPYSPEMNPIEHVWKTLKKHINHMRGESTLTEIMQEAKLFLDERTFDYKLFGQKYCKNILEKHPYAIR